MTQAQTPRYAEVEVNWKSVLKQLWAKASVHYAFVHAEFETMVREILECPGQEPSACGVKVHWFDENGNEYPPNVIPPGVGLGDLVSSLVTKLEEELAQSLVPTLGQPGDVDYGRFVFKGNFQKISVERHEIIPVYYFPPDQTIQAATSMGIGCLKGDVDQLILWNVNNAACKALLNSTNLGPDGEVPN